MASSSVWRRQIAIGIITSGTLAAVSACGSTGHATHRDALLIVPVSSTVTVRIRSVTGLGAILTDARGDALYMFPPDAGSTVKCTGTCAGTWPPLVIAAGQRPRAGSGVNPENLSTRPDPNTGARIVTYAGYPLYRYAGDVSPGQANGQALFNNGGPWYVLDADGNPVTTDPAIGR